MLRGVRAASGSGQGLLAPGPPGSGRVRLGPRSAARHGVGNRVHAGVSPAQTAARFGDSSTKECRGPGRPPKSPYLSQRSALMSNIEVVAIWMSATPPQRGAAARAPRRDLRVYRRRRRGEPGCKACRHDAAMLAGAVTAGIAYCCQCCVYTTKVDQASDGGCARLELRLKGFTRAGRAGRAGQRRIFAEAGAAGVRRCGGRGGPAGCWISRHETKNGNGGHGSDS